MMRPTPSLVDQPWTRPGWQPSAGNGPVLFYIVLVHALALVGLFLSPLPSPPVPAVALAFAAVGGVGTTVCYHRSLAHTVKSAIRNMGQGVMSSRYQAIAVREGNEV